MSISHKHFRDITCSEDFYSDYDRAPEKIQQRITLITEIIAESGHIPNSMQAHKASFVGDIWIAYVTTSKTAWRVLFEVEGNVLVFSRLLTHRDMDNFLRKITK